MSRITVAHRNSLALAISALLASGAVAAADPNASTTLTITPSPATLSGDAAEDVVADTLTTSLDPVISALIDEGKVQLEMATLAGLPVQNSTPGFVWTKVVPDKQPVGGATASALDLDGLGFVVGSTASFRAHYVTGGGRTKAETHSSPAIDVTAVASCDGFNISADFASGNGSPTPGSGGPWAFRINVENCTGVDLTGIKTQGGSNGWAPMISFVPSTGTVNVKQNNKNQVLTWAHDLPSGSTATLLVNVDGKIPASAACDSIRYLSGAWSSVYNAGAGSQKSPYTGRVSIQVTCPVF